MKKTILTVAVLISAFLAFIIAGTSSCGNNNTAQNNTPPPEPKPTAPSAPTTNTVIAAPTNPAPATAVAAPAVTNPPPVAATPAPASEPAPTLPPVTKPVVKVVEMPATTPAPPKNFYSEDTTKNHQCCAALATNQNYYFRVRAGYQHVNHGDNNDTWFASAKFYARPDALRERAGKNAWLIPDAEAEFAHEYLAKPDNRAHPGSGEGISLRADFFWPWMHWTTRVMARTNAICPFCQPLALGFGPVVNVGFDQLLDGSEARLARYAGVRMTLNRDGYIEYTAGGTDGLAGTRQQIAAELPICQSSDREVRYILRGLWNTGAHNTPDLLQGGLFVEMPLGILVTPDKWHDFVPFGK